MAVALVGMPKLLLNLKGPNSEFKQLFSRVSVKMELGEMLPEADLKQIAAAVLKTNDEALLQKVVKTAKPCRCILRIGKRSRCRPNPRRRDAWRNGRCRAKCRRCRLNRPRKILNRG